MKNSFLILFGVLIEMTCLAQKHISLDSVIKIDKDLISFNVFDTSLVCTYSKPQNDSSYIIINESITDTLFSAVIRNPVFMNNNIFFNSDVYLEFENKNYKKLIYSFKNNRFNEYNSWFLHDNGYQQVYRFDGLKLFLVDPLLDKLLMFVDFTDYLMNADYVKKETDDYGEQYPLVSIRDVFFINKNEAIVTLCKQGDFEGCYGYYYFYISNEKLIDVTNKLELKEGLNSYNTQEPYFDFISSDNNYFRLSINTPGGKKEKTSQVIDKTITDIHTVLNLTQTSIIGINLQKSEVQYYFLHSTTNNKMLVLIPYKFIPSLDLAMYKAYNNSALTKEDLKGFGEYELSILRNLIFAKYNYDFSSEFYQAYFNLYVFYNTPEMRNSRTKDLNGKLTDADEANLKLIKSME